MGAYAHLYAYVTGTGRLLEVTFGRLQGGERRGRNAYGFSGSVCKTRQGSVTDSRIERKMRARKVSGGPFTRSLECQAQRQGFNQVGNGETSKALGGVGMAGNSGVSACPQRGWCGSEELWAAGGRGTESTASR